ncbi:hypothetical protein ONS95_013785 [Cadophora gregata]|uniref:uncharacterized protein n=1 Tax=Cadophora gregata TaxID=51156 RepID=UPI0026DC626E|nr:uncharacterized protein ONS95_013785 [Cadophora gregata]KAK0113534.1 hypothetical protein ONS96_014393 [Cadophora gregata f. sp. sojae]KAK0114289.1 hypothetical protein ONS95_013785 [Cadophora gregata]
MRNLPKEVVAATETVVEVNNGVLESAFIHSLAKIYKTSPQAVVWNMKRYNKVKAGCDDRKPGGRPVAMDKDKAAEYIRIFMTEAQLANERISLHKVAELVSQEFKVAVSSTWISRIMKKYEIDYQPPKQEPKRAQKRAPKAPKAPSALPTNPDRLPLPALPEQYPSFRESLQQAMSTSEPPPSRFGSFQQITVNSDLPTQTAPTYSHTAPAPSLPASRITQIDASRLES